MKQTPTETHEGFLLRKSKVDLPLSNEYLDPKLQQDLLISHLFANSRRRISEIARLGVKPRKIVESLLAQGVVWERRQVKRAA